MCFFYVYFADMDAKTFLLLSEQSPGLANHIVGLLHSKGILNSKKDASMFLNKRADYYRSGISCECCYHRCSLRELSMYCKDGDKILARIGQSLFF